MKKEIMELWVKELKSGYWQQGKYFLEHSGFFCVYGVLANLAALYGVCSHSGQNLNGFDKKITVVPESVIQWAELKSPIGEIPGLKYSLAEMNDNGKSFKDLAEVIEKHWSEL